MLKWVHMYMVPFVLKGRQLRLHACMQGCTNPSWLIVCGCSFYLWVFSMERSSLGPSGAYIFEVCRVLENLRITTRMHREASFIVWITVIIYFADREAV